MQSEGLQAGFESELILIGSGVLRCQDLRARVCVGGAGVSQGLEVQNSLGLGSGIFLSWGQGLQVLG